MDEPGKAETVIEVVRLPPKGMGLFWCSYEPSLLFSPNALLIRRDWETLFQWTPSPATATPSNSFGNHIWKLRSETLSFYKFPSQNCQCISCTLHGKCHLRIPEQNVFSHSAPPHFLVNSVLLLSVGLVLFSSITLRSLSHTKQSLDMSHSYCPLEQFFIVKFFVYVYFEFHIFIL